MEKRTYPTLTMLYFLKLKKGNDIENQWCWKLLLNAIGAIKKIKMKVDSIHKYLLYTASWGPGNHSKSTPGGRPIFLKPKFHKESKSGYFFQKNILGAKKSSENQLFYIYYSNIRLFWTSNTWFSKIKVTCEIF